MVVCPEFIKTNLQKSALGADENIAAREQKKIIKFMQMICLVDDWQ